MCDSDIKLFPVKTHWGTYEFTITHSFQITSAIDGKKWNHFDILWYKGGDVYHKAVRGVYIIILNNDIVYVGDFTSLNYKASQTKYVQGWTKKADNITNKRIHRKILSVLNKNKRGANNTIEVGVYLPPAVLIGGVYYVNTELVEKRLQSEYETLWNCEVTTEEVNQHQVQFLSIGR